VDPIQEEVRRFVVANIDSVVHLEILRILGENPDIEWSAAELAQEVQTPAQTLKTHLTVLHARGLVVLTTKATELFCRYGAGTPELENRMRHLLQVYRERPVTMINLVYAKAKEMLKTFAEAFRLKKES
jgi:predicted ArsR family transcriptional regulator